MRKEGDKEYMKKYEKPRVRIERFELSQHIAACAWDMLSSKRVEECYAVSDSGWGLPAGVHAFNTGVDGCSDGPLESYCYTNADSGSNIFNS